MLGCNVMKCTECNVMVAWFDPEGDHPDCKILEPVITGVFGPPTYLCYNSDFCPAEMQKILYVLRKIGNRKIFTCIFQGPPFWTIFCSIEWDPDLATTYTIRLPG